MKCTTRRTTWLTTAAVGGLAAVALVGAPIASAAEQGEVQRGAAILGAIHNGQQTCADLTSADFGAVGEFAMQRMVGSAQAHEAMDRTMTRMMGPSGLDSMHRYLGQRFSGCARGPAPRGIAGIMGMMGMMNGTGRGYGPGMMGGRLGQGNAYGPGMMGGAFGTRGNHDDGGWSSAATGATILIGVLLLLLAGAAVASRRRSWKPATGGPIEILDRRFASGEIDGEEYRRRRAALGGSQ